MKKLRLPILVIMFTMAALLLLPSKQVFAASGYQRIHTTTSAYDKSERTVGGAEFASYYNNSKRTNIFSVTVDGKKTNLTVLNGADPDIITNGNTIYYHKLIKNADIIYKTTVKNSTPVTIYKKSASKLNGSYVSIDFIGYYKNSIYFTKGYEEYVYRIDVKTGKCKKIASNAGETIQNGRYFLLQPGMDELYAYPSRVYDAVEETVTKLCKKCIFDKITSKYIYYAQVKEDHGKSDGHPAFTVSIKRADRDGSNKKTLVSDLAVGYVKDITSTYVEYVIFKNNEEVTKKYKYFSSITFDPNGGTMDNSQLKYENGKKFGTLPIPAYEGKTFTGWYTSKTGTTKITENTEVTKNRTLYAQWIDQEIEITVNDIANGNAEKELTLIQSFKESYFNTSSSKNADNSSFVELSALTAEASSNGSRTIKLLKDAEFADIQKRFSKDGSSDHVSSEEDNDHAVMFLGNRPMEDGSILAAVFLNGYSGDGYEWVSNFNLGDQKIHQGFDLAANEVVKQLDDYLSECKLTDKKVKLWITGHSRAAAITNLVTKKLMDRETEGSRKKFAKENIFAFGFATPQYIIVSDEAEIEKYDNIINFVSPHDFVPYVAPQDWGFARLGKNIIFDTSLETKMREYSKEYTGNEYGGYTVKEREDIINAFSTFGVNQEKYGSPIYKVDGTSFSPQFYAQQGIALILNKNSETRTKGVRTLLSLSLRNNNASTMTNYLVMGGASSKIEKSHMMVSYIAWIHAYYENRK